MLQSISAKHVKNNAVINKDVSQKALLSAYQQEIQKLRQQLSSQGRGSLNEEELQMLEREKEAAQKEKVIALDLLVRTVIHFCTYCWL